MSFENKHPDRVRQEAAEAGRFGGQVPFSARKPSGEGRRTGEEKSAIITKYRTKRNKQKGSQRIKI